jgi:hypothetical protein
MSKVCGAEFGRYLLSHAHARNVSAEASEHPTSGLGNIGCVPYCPVAFHRIAAIVAAVTAVSMCGGQQSEYDKISKAERCGTILQRSAALSYDMWLINFKG